MLIRNVPPWQIPESLATPEKLFLSRRGFLAATASAALAACLGPAPSSPELERTIPKVAPPYPVKRNARYRLDRPLSDQHIAATYNNFYEFTSVKDRVWTRTGSFRVEPWTVEITGLVNKPQTFSIDDLLKTMPLEERTYRHRCVEAWAMAVPWSGFPLAALLQRTEPKSNARFVRFFSFS